MALAESYCSQLANGYKGDWGGEKGKMVGEKSWGGGLGKRGTLGPKMASLPKDT